MKSGIGRILLALAFLVLALYIIWQAPEYDLEYQYESGDIRMIFNDKEITRDTSKLPQTVILVNGEIFLSQDTVDILFDKNLYYEEKYDTLITTTNDHRADLKVDSKVMKVDGKTTNLTVPPMRVKYSYRDDNRYTNGKKGTMTEDIIYLPIKALEEVYGITVEFKDKVIITEANQNRVRVLLNPEDSVELKHAKDSFAKNVEIMGSGDYFDIFDYDETSDFVWARSADGELGYIEHKELQSYNMAPTTTKQEEEIPEKVHIAWDYLHPNTTTLSSEMASRGKIAALDVVAPTILYLKNTKGELKYQANLAREYIRWAKQNDYRVWATVKNDDFDIQETSTFLNDMNSRETATQELLGFAEDYAIEGINVDVEWVYQKDATAFSQWIRELCVEAKQKGIIISVCVNVPDGSPDWSLCYQHKALSEYADYLAVMTYDQYGASSKAPGPNASLDWVMENLEKIITRDGVMSQKILLGIPFYSRLWTATGQSIKQTTLTMSGAKGYLNRGNATTWLDDAGQYFYENEAGTTLLWIEENASIAKKVALVNQYNLAGTAYWRLGFETEDVWDTIGEALGMNS